MRPPKAGPGVGLGVGLVLGVLAGWWARPLAAAPDPAETLRRVQEDVLNRHPDAPSRDVLTYAAIHGMMAPLDRWTRYYAPSEVSALTADPPDMGIDAVTTVADCGLLVNAVSGVSAKAGLHVGDCILSVDGTALAGVPGEARAARLLGASRTASVLSVTRAQAAPGSGPELVAVRRGWRGATPLEVREGPERTAAGLVRWLTVRSFPVGLCDLWPVPPATDRARPMVVDLRGDPGGELSEAVRFVDRFVTEGVIVGAAVRGEPTRSNTAKNDGVEVTGPLVVLVDEGTASAAEITAAALRERAHARVVGRPTVGKRAIETIVRYEDGSALQLTIGRFDVAGGGIPIDVPVAPGADEATWTAAALAALP